MINIERTLNSERLIKAILGICLDEFNRLLPAFVEASSPNADYTQSGAPRKRVPGGGRKHRL